MPVAGGDTDEVHFPNLVVTYQYVDVGLYHISFVLKGFPSCLQFCTGDENSPL